MSLLTNFKPHYQSSWYNREVRDYEKKNSLFHIYRVHTSEPDLKRQFIRVFIRCEVSKKKEIDFRVCVYFLFGIKHQFLHQEIYTF